MAVQAGSTVSSASVRCVPARLQGLIVVTSGVALFTVAVVALLPVLAGVGTAWQQAVNGLVAAAARRGGPARTGTRPPSPPSPALL